MVHISQNMEGGSLLLFFGLAGFAGAGTFLHKNCLKCMDQTVSQFFFLKKTASPPHTPTPPTFPPFSVGVPLSAICAKFNQLPFFQYYCFISGSGRIEVYLVNDGLKFPPSSTRGFVCPPQKALVGAAAGHQGKAGHPIHTCRPNTGSTKWRANVHAL